MLDLDDVHHTAVQHTPGDIALAHKAGGQEQWEELRTQFAGNRFTVHGSGWWVFGWMVQTGGPQRFPAYKRFEMACFVVDRYMRNLHID